MEYSIDLSGMLHYDLEQTEIHALFRYINSRLFRLGLYNVTTTHAAGVPIGSIRHIVEKHGTYLDLVLQNIVANIYSQGIQNKQVRLGATPGGRYLVLVLV